MENSRILTAYSIAGLRPMRGAASEPPIGTTPRYNAGASRRFTRSSSRQKCLRNASVLKSTNGSLTGFLILYA